MKLVSAVLVAKIANIVLHNLYTTIENTCNNVTCMNIMIITECGVVLPLFYVTVEIPLS